MRSVVKKGERPPKRDWDKLLGNLKKDTELPIPPRPNASLPILFVFSILFALLAYFVQTAFV